MFSQSKKRRPCFLQNTNGFPVFQKKGEDSTLYIFCKEFQGDDVWVISDRLMDDDHFYYINPEYDSTCPASGKIVPFSY